MREASEISRKWAEFLVRDRSYLKRYGVGIVIAVTLFLVTWLLGHFDSQSRLYSINLGSAILAAAYGGWGPGILCAFTEAVLVDYYFAEPTGKIFDSFTSVVRVFVYVSFAAFTTWLVQWLRTSLRDQTRLRVEAENGVRLRERILAIVSHDLRNPLAGIQMSAKIIQKAIKDETTVKLAENIASGTIQMERLICDLLDVGKIERGTFSLQIAEANVEELIFEAKKMVLASANEKGMKIEVQYEAPVRIAHLDRDRMLQVLCNLLRNAIKFSPEQSVIVIKVDGLPGNALKVQIVDQGDGVPMDERKNLFIPHWQRQETAHLGTGLGLFICKTIVNLHGGEIGLEEHAGPGSTFFFSIPIAQNKG